MTQPLQRRSCDDKCLNKAWWRFQWTHLKLGIRHARPKGIIHRNCLCSHFVVWPFASVVCIRTLHRDLTHLRVQTSIRLLIFRFEDTSCG